MFTDGGPSCYRRGQILQILQRTVESTGRHGNNGCVAPSSVPPSRCTALTILTVHKCTAPTKASSTEGNGYDVYDLWDLGEFDAKGAVRTKYGTKEELIDAIKTAKQNGVASYLDAVLNHKAGADKTETFKVVEVDNDDRNKEVSGAVRFTTSSAFLDRMQASRLLYSTISTDGLALISPVERGNTASSSGPSLTSPVRFLVWKNGWNPADIVVDLGRR